MLTKIKITNYICVSFYSYTKNPLSTLSLVPDLITKPPYSDKEQTFTFQLSLNGMVILPNEHGFRNEIYKDQKHVL